MVWLKLEAMAFGLSESVRHSSTNSKELRVVSCCNNYALRVAALPQPSAVGERVALPVVVPGSRLGSWVAASLPASRQGVVAGLVSGPPMARRVARRVIR